MYSKQSHKTRRWEVIISNDYQVDEMSLTLAAEHFRLIHLCKNCVRRSRSKMKVFRRKWLISESHFDVMRRNKSSFSFHQLYERWSCIARCLNSFRFCKERFHYQCWFFCLILSSSASVYLNLFAWLQLHELSLARLENHCSLWLYCRQQYLSISRVWIIEYWWKSCLQIAQNQNLKKDSCIIVWSTKKKKWIFNCWLKISTLLLSLTRWS